MPDTDATVERHNAIKKAMWERETELNTTGLRKEPQNNRGPWSTPKTSPFKKKGLRAVEQPE
jgi:hypothetical protein